MWNCDTRKEILEQHPEWEVHGKVRRYHHGKFRGQMPEGSVLLGLDTYVAGTCFSAGNLTCAEASVLLLCFRCSTKNDLVDWIPPRKKSCRVDWPICCCAIIAKTDLEMVKNVGE